MIRRFLAKLKRGGSCRSESHPLEKAPPHPLEHDFASCVELLYWRYLGRSPDDAGLQAHIAALRGGVRISDLAHTISISPEALARRRNSLFDTMSDGEFVVAIAELLFHGRGALPEDVEHWKRFLAEEPTNRLELLRRAAEAFLAEKTRADRWQNDPRECWIMGTKRKLTLSAWTQRAEACRQNNGNQGEPSTAASRRSFEHSGEFLVSAIATMYKGRRHIRRFLDNITSQTLFDRSELIIIDAGSPENEQQVILEYQSLFPNIVYKRFDYRIGIYDAWNAGVELSRGRFLTTTNLDDLRRQDSFQIQAAALQRHAFADIVYQDFYYTLDDELSFDQIQTIGFKSELPIITPHNLLKFNSPHCAPMWRKALHQQLGLFDTRYRSAGDWEFWLRCMLYEKKFLKSNTPHVAYFQNPEGVSTRPTTAGIEEGAYILRAYADKLIAPELRMSRADLARIMGRTVDWDATSPAYNVVQREICRFASEFRKTG